MNSPEVTSIAAKIATALEQRPLLVFTNIVSPQEVQLIRNSKSGKTVELPFDDLFPGSQGRFILGVAEIFLSSLAGSSQRLRTKNAGWQIRKSPPKKTIEPELFSLHLYAPKLGGLTVQHYSDAQDPTPDITGVVRPESLIIVHGIHRASLAVTQDMRTGEKGQVNKSYFSTSISLQNPPLRT